MKVPLLRSAAFLLLFTFSFHQISFASPISFAPVDVHKLNSQSAFEDFLKARYNKDSSGLSEHDRRTNDIRQIIEEVDSALRDYFASVAEGTRPLFGGLAPEMSSLLQNLLNKAGTFPITPGLI